MRPTGPTSVRRTTPRRSTALSLDAIAADPPRLRIAYSVLSFTGEPVHPDCRAAVLTPRRCARELGHEMVEADPNVDIDRFMRAWTNIVACGTELTVRSRRRNWAGPNVDDSIDGVTRGAVALGRTVSGADYLDAVNTVHAIGRQMARFVADERGFDMLLTATLAEPPAEIGRFTPGQRRLHRLPHGHRTACWPTHRSPRSPTAPASRRCRCRCTGTRTGCRSGPTSWRRAGEEALLLQLAAQLERADPWFDTHPPAVTRQEAVAALARAIRRSGGRVGGGCLRGGSSRSSCVEAWVMVSTARSNAASVAGDVFCTPLILRTY